MAKDYHHSATNWFPKTSFFFGANIGFFVEDNTTSSYEKRWKLEQLMPTQPRPREESSMLTLHHRRCHLFPLSPQSMLENQERCSNPNSKEEERVKFVNLQHGFLYNLNFKLVCFVGCLEKLKEKKGKRANFFHFELNVKFGFSWKFSWFSFLDLLLVFHYWWKLI